MLLYLCERDIRQIQRLHQNGYGTPTNGYVVAGNENDAWVTADD
jgi:hypothetical protein